MITGGGIVEVTIIDDDGSNLTASSIPSKTSGEIVTEADLAPIVTEAINRWKGILGANSPLIGTLYNLDYQVVNFNDLTLGHATSDTIFIDADAAGYGWFVDETPVDDAEFAAESSEADGKMDLLTAVMHEMGHAIGLKDLNESKDPDALMSERLEAGERIEPDTNDTSIVKMDDADQAATFEESLLTSTVQHRNAWLVEFLTENAKGDYNPFEPIEEIYIKL